jgi:hypothetical protein
VPGNDTLRKGQLARICQPGRSPRVEQRKARTGDQTLYRKPTGLDFGLQSHEVRANRSGRARPAMVQVPDIVQRHYPVLAPSLHGLMKQLQKVLPGAAAAGRRHPANQRDVHPCPLTTSMVRLTLWQEQGDARNLDAASTLRPRLQILAGVQARRRNRSLACSA